MTRSAILIAAALIFSGCAGMSDTQQRTLTGAGGGAVGGALIGALAGNAGLGAAIGGAAGAGSGYLYDRHVQSRQRSYNEGVVAGRASAAR